MSFFLEVPMFGPFQNTTINTSAGQSAETLRADLLTTSPQSSTELPTKAVGSIATTQVIPTELPPHIHEIANQIGQIESEYKALQDKGQRAKQLDEIRSKLLLGKNQLNTGVFNLKSTKNTLDDINTLNDNIKDKNIEFFDFKKKISEFNNKVQNIKDPNLAGLDDQLDVIWRIDEALNVINNIIDKFNSENSSSYDKILNLTGSISGLNTARNTVDKTQLSLNVATNAVDMIMTNIKSAVFSHGKVSNDIVKLILA